MKRLFGQALVVGLVGSGAAALTPACADNDQSIYIRHVMAPPTNRTNGGCSYQADPSQPALFEGRLDVAIARSYTMVILVGGQFVTRGDSLTARAEPNKTHLNGAVVKVTDPNGATIGEFTAIGSGFVDQAESNTASFGLIQITAIDSTTIDRLGVTADTPKLVIANVRVFGKTLGGVDVESGEFQYPIRVCRGCLIDFSKGDDPATTGLDCNLEIDANATGQTQAPCNIGMDEATPCQLCRSFSNECKGQL